MGSDVPSSDAGSAVLTRRLKVRPPTEDDRPRFVELFCDEAFMAFSAGVLSTVAAHDRFDQMLVRCSELAFAKQPVIERSTGAIIGYTGVDWFFLEGRRHLEYGYRLVPNSRGKGYATEASAALLTKAARSFHGEVLAIIAPANRPSQNVIRKLAFDFWKQAPVDGRLRDLYRRRIDPPFRGSSDHSRPP
jgi:RimJ/RimL family protein N-acetyltransferase